VDVRAPDASGRFVGSRRGVAHPGRYPLGQGGEAGVAGRAGRPLV